MVFIFNKPYIHNKEIIDNIYLVQQFYIHDNVRRYNEIYTELKESITNTELKIPNSLNNIIKK